MIYPFAATFPPCCAALSVSCLFPTCQRISYFFMHLINATNIPGQYWMQQKIGFRQHLVFFPFVQERILWRTVFIREGVKKKREKSGQADRLGQPPPSPEAVRKM